jgi:hypothetical protein
MSVYRVTPLKDQRVLNYRFSVDSKTDPEYIKLAASVKAHNIQESQRERAGLEPHYLRIRGRGRNPIKSGPQNTYSVNDDNCTFFDVYVQRDTDAMNRYRLRAAKTKTKGLLTRTVASVQALVAPSRQHA